jgi:thioredoxin-like negative regulator of GroEL
LENLANDFSGNLNVIFVSADVDKCGGAAHEYQVSSIPDTRIFVNGQEKKKVVGADIQ